MSYEFKWNKGEISLMKLITWLTVGGDILTVGLSGVNVSFHFPCQSSHSSVMFVLKDEDSLHPGYEL